MQCLPNFWHPMPLKEFMTRIEKRQNGLDLPVYFDPHSEYTLEMRDGHGVVLMQTQNLINDHELNREVILAVTCNTVNGKCDYGLSS
jgi:hypothetical protein